MTGAQSGSRVARDRATRVLAGIRRVAPALDRLATRLPPRVHQHTGAEFDLLVDHMQGQYLPGLW